MATIRKYKKSDFDSLRKICLETSGIPVETEKERQFLFLMYNDYYKQAEGENCFVAVDDNDEAVGYILCGENFDEYYKVFKGLYLPEIEKLGLKFRFMALSEIYIHKLFSKKNPAHLHIDILDSYQGQGLGSQLINSLKEHLKEKNIHSLMLSCGENNKGAIKFYEKNGFIICKKILGCCIMACNF